MFDLFENLGPWVQVIEGLVLILLAIATLWGGPKFLKALNKVINLLEKITGRDLDGDGDISDRPAS